MGNLSNVDTIKIIGYVITALSGATASQVHNFFPFTDTQTAQTIATWVCAFAFLGTLVFSTIKKQTPDGDLHTVYSTSIVPTAPTLTTSALEKKAKSIP